jgi:F0F1-type ATP synthase assembly protein I
MDGRHWWITAAQFTGLGWYIALAIVAPTLGGVWLDRRVGTTPLFLLLGVLLGVALAFYGTYRMSITYLSGPPSARPDDEGPRP